MFLRLLVNSEVHEKNIKATQINYEWIQERNHASHPHEMFKSPLKSALLILLSWEILGFQHESMLFHF